MSLFLRRHPGHRWLALPLVRKEPGVSASPPFRVDACSIDEKTNDIRCSGQSSSCFRRPAALSCRVSSRGLAAIRSLGPETNGLRPSPAVSRGKLDDRHRAALAERPPSRTPPTSPEGGFDDAPKLPHFVCTACSLWIASTFPEEVTCPCGPSTVRLVSLLCALATTCSAARDSAPAALSQTFPSGERQATNQDENQSNLTFLAFPRSTCRLRDTAGLSRLSPGSLRGRGLPGASNQSG